MRFRSSLATALVVLLIAACGGSASPTPSIFVVGPGSSSGIIPILVTPEFGVGQNHFVFTLVDATNTPIAAPDRTVTLQLAPSAGGSPAASTSPTFVWGIVGTVGFYVSDVVFPSAGTWKATFMTAAPGSAGDSVTQEVEVKDRTSAVAIGQAAPSVKTPTAGDVGGNLKEISTDQKPDPRFYELSEDQALAQHKPFVLVFATPAFCRSATCGPALDHVKGLADEYPDVTFIHVEPYQMTFTDGALRASLDANGDLQSNDVTNAWGILSEPWVYVVDKEGIVRASFPSVFSDEEFKAAVSSLS